MNKSISILLGAGFSAPIGYPIGNDLNNLLLNCKNDNHVFCSSGTLVVMSDGSTPDIGYKTSYGFEYDFCIRLIEYFNEIKGYFDYEEFYDFIKYELKENQEIENIGKPFLSPYHDTVKNLISGLINIYTQLVSYYLVDREGNKYYDNAGYMSGFIFPGYTGILNCLSKLGKDSIINIHTLNHDLFFERFNSSDWLKGELCDGFQELGSPYYGELDVNGRTYLCRLARYTGQYEKKYRLYKLHGSRDYGIFYGTKGIISTPEIYIKTRFGIGFSELYKEKQNEDLTYEYERCWINYHADFLTGTTSKINRYNEPILYKKLFEYFKQNLKDAELLVIIGYGGKDSEINQLLEDNFDYKNKSCIIIDPYPGIKVKELSQRIGAEIIQKHLDEICIEEIMK